MYQALTDGPDPSMLSDPVLSKYLDDLEHKKKSQEAPKKRCKRNEKYAVRLLALASLLSIAAAYSKILGF
jgi:hypothetical protein